MRVVTRGDRAIKMALAESSHLSYDRILLEHIRDRVIASSKQSFDTKVAPGGHRWPEPRWYNDGKLMYDKGTLKASIRGLIQGNVITVYSADPRAASLGEGEEIAGNMLVPVTREIAEKVKLAGGWREAYDDAFILKPKESDTGQAYLISKTEGLVGVFRTRVKIPARRFLGISRGASLSIERAIGARMKQIWAKGEANA